MKYPGITFLKDYNEYFDKRAEAITLDGTENLEAFHE